MAANNDVFYALLRRSVARSCQNIGWHGVHNSSFEILTNVLGRYIMVLGRTASEYANLAEHCEPNMIDLLETFKTLDIDERGLLDFVRNVECHTSTPLPCLPVSCSQTYLFNGPVQTICHMKATLNLTSVEDSGEEDCLIASGDEVDKDHLWEEIPGYLPPLPKITKDVEDDESGIHTDDDALATPTSMKSPLGMTHAHVKEGESRRSSLSDEVVGGGFAQLPTTFRRQSTVGSPITPTSVPLTPVIHSDSCQVDCPVDVSETKKFVYEPTEKPEMLLDLKVSADEHLTTEKDSRLPELHPFMSPTTVVPPAITVNSPPLLSPLTKATPTCISTSFKVSLRPVLHKISSPPLRDLVEMNEPLEEEEMRVSSVSSASFSPVPSPKSPAKLEATFAHVNESLSPSSIPSSLLSLTSSPLALISPRSNSPPPSHHLSPVLSHHSLDLNQPVTPSGSPSQDFVPATSFMTPSISSYLPLVSPSCKLADKELCIPKTLEDQTLSVSSSSVSSEFSSLDSNDDKTIPETVSRHPVPTTDPPSPHLSVQSFSPHSAVLPSIDVESYSTYSSDSLSSSSISSTPASQADLGVSLPHLSSLPPLLLTNVAKSPMSCQEEEDSSDTSESSKESLHFPITKSRKESQSFGIKEKIPQFQLGSCSPEYATGPLTVRIKKLSLDLLKGSYKSPQTTSTVVGPGPPKYQNVDSIFLKCPVPMLPKESCIPEIQPLQSSSSFVVKINRSVLKQEKAFISPKVTSSKPELTGIKAIKGDNKIDAGPKVSRIKTRINRKRELELSEIGLVSKKMRKRSPEPIKSDIFSAKRLSHSARSSSTDARVTRKTRSQSSDDESASDNSTSLKLKLKIPKQPSSIASASSPVKKSAKKFRAQMQSSFPDPKGDSNFNTPSPKASKLSEGLLVTSSIPKKVPSIKIPKIVHTPSPPPLMSISKQGIAKETSGVHMKSSISMRSVGSRGGPQLYICPICKLPDDGTPMICCDNCDIWLHMRCVGLTQPPPENETWYCTKCARKKKKRK